MSDTDLRTRPSRVCVDPSTDGHVLLLTVDENFRHHLIKMTPANASKLGQMLIAVAARVESPTSSAGPAANAARSCTGHGRWRAATA